MIDVETGQLLFNGEGHLTDQTTDDPEIAALAKEFVEEESEHVAELLKWIAAHKADWDKWIADAKAAK